MVHLLNIAARQLQPLNFLRRAINTFFYTMIPLFLFSFFISSFSKNWHLNSHTAAIWDLYVTSFKFNQWEVPLLIGPFISPLIGQFVIFYHIPTRCDSQPDFEIRGNHFIGRNQPRIQFEAHWSSIPVIDKLVLWFRSVKLSILSSHTPITRLR